MNNFPAMTEEQRELEIASVKEMRSHVDFWGHASGFAAEFLMRCADAYLATLTAEPEYYFRKRSDGGREGPIHHTETEDSRKVSWSPLYTTPPAPVLKPIELPGKGGVEATSEKSIRD